LNIHFVHEKSDNPDAIPLILLHGWPSSFLEFLAIAEPLRTNANGTDYSRPFHVIIPSLPGFAFSDAAPANWTLRDTARIFNTLMTDILGYKTYAVHGTDWGSVVAWNLYGDFNQTVRALHLSFIPKVPYNREELAERNITLEPEQELPMDMFLQWQRIGTGYSQLLSTKACLPCEPTKEIAGNLKLTTRPAQHNIPCSSRQPHWPASLDGREIYRL
jgi:pimeloyl-ACP methyl ester carboxylesterase